MIAAADVRAKPCVPGEGDTPLPSRVRSQSCQVVARDYAFDCLGKVFIFGRTLGLGTIQRYGDHFPPRGDECPGMKKLIRNISFIIISTINHKPQNVKQ